MKRIFTALIGLLVITNTSLFAQTETEPGVDDAYIHADDLPLMNIGHQFRLIYQLTNNGNDPITGIGDNNITFTIQLQKCAPHIGGVVTSNGLAAISGTFLNYFDVTYDDVTKEYSAIQTPGVEFPGITDANLPMDIQINVVVTALSTNIADFSIGGVFELIPPADAATNNVSNDIASVFTSSQSLLPVTLLSFEGGINGCNINLNWATSLETKFSHFEVEYSENGIDFSTIKTVQPLASPGVRNYQTSITQNVAVAYYRLKMIDLDGTYSYSNKVLQFKTTCSNNRIVLFPNPVVNDKATINGLRANSLIQIHHADGKLIETIKVLQSVHQINMSGYAKGIYIITIINESKVVESFKVVK